MRRTALIAVIGAGAVDLTGGHGSNAALEAVGHIRDCEQAYGVVRPAA